VTNKIPIRRRLLYFYFAVRNRLEALRYDLGFWRTVPPPHAVKRRIVRAYAVRYGLRTLVETGTYMGEMIAGMVRRFDRIYTIELQPVFYEKAVARFARRPHVTLLHGDSGREIAGVVPALEGPALFWLDAHYSGGATARGDLDSPIVAELRHILGQSSARHVVLVDDARAFDGTQGYPTLDELRRLVTQWRPDYAVVVDNDVIRITPPTQ
jgi:hypothetical protein